LLIASVQRPTQCPLAPRERERERVRLERERERQDRGRIIEGKARRFDEEREKQQQERGEKEPWLWLVQYSNLLKVSKMERGYPPTWTKQLIC
jgi:hypothetical protein